MTIRAVIAEDEPLARTSLRVNLQSESDIVVVGEAEDGLLAIEAVKRLLPDLLFLDIVMPKASGFEVLEALSSHHLPAVVFVTAFDHFAIKAFEFHGVDYLLKPFTRDRFLAALDAARLAVSRAGGLGAHIKLAGLLDSEQTATKGLSPRHYDAAGRRRIATKHRGRVVLVNVEDISWIEAGANYAILHVKSQTHMLRATMAQMLDLLDPEKFARIHRSTIVAIGQIVELRPQGHSDYDVVLADGTVLKLSRHYRAALFSTVPSKARLKQTR